MASDYLLTAQLAGGRPRLVGINATNDIDATVYAIHEIMDRACQDKTGPWAKGVITLLRPDGSVLRTMEQKVS